MKFRTCLLVVLSLILTASLFAQTTLDPNQFVNTQITGPGVYKVEGGKFYAFDGRIDLTYEITIEGPDNGWIRNVANPPVLVNTPAGNGAARQFFELREGGAITIKNVLLSGTNSNGEVVGIFIANTGGRGFIVDNCVFADWQDFALRNQYKGAEIRITNSVFINGVRLRNNPWGGFPIRMDVACDKVLIENNTVVNSGRLLCNRGPFFNADIYELHNTYLNQAENGHEQRANEMIQANNIFYNYQFLGRKGGTAVHPSNISDSHFTNSNLFAEAKDSLDKISLYLGQNLFYREDEIMNWFTTSGGDSILPGLLWEEHADVDSFVNFDDNYHIGTNYAEFDPQFTVHPGNTEAIVNFINAYWLNPTGNWVDWRIESQVSFGDNGLPVLNWPPAFDLSYANEYLKTAGTDGLPLGDLNWWPDAKETYLANRDSYVAALKDSIEHAKALYVPGSPTPMKTPSTTAVDRDGAQPVDYALGQNYPNPFNPTTTIEYQVGKAGVVTIEMFNTLGQKVKTLVNGHKLSGTYSLNVDGSDLSSGVYFYTIQIQAGDFTQTKKMVLMK